MTSTLARAATVIGMFLCVGCDRGPGVREQVVGEDTRLRIEGCPSGSNRPIYISPDWQKLAVIQHYADTSNQVFVDGAPGPKFPSVNPGSVEWSPGGRYCAYAGGTWGHVSLVVGPHRIDDIEGRYRLVFSPDDQRWAVVVFKPARPAKDGQPERKAATMLVVDGGAERQLGDEPIEGLRFDGPGNRLFYKAAGKWLGEDGQPAPQDRVAGLDAPPPPPAPPVVGTPKRPITTEQYIKSVGHKPYKLFVAGKLVGEYDEFLTHNLPRVWQPGEPGRQGYAGKKFYHVNPDGSATLYAIRGGKLLRLTVD